MKSTILIVDDNVDNLSVLEAMLLDHGYDVRVARSGTVALKSIYACKPDLILLDILMPVMNGVEVCRQLKKDQATSTIPVLFISALGDLGDKLAAFDAGGQDYIGKPFFENEVIARVRTHLRLHATESRLKDEIALATRALADRNAILEVALAEASAANTAKSQFLATMSHELRTPLHGIIGMNELILKSVLSPEQESMAKTVQECGLHLSEVIGNILDMADLTAGGLRLVPRITNTRHLMDAVLTSFAPSVQIKKLHISCDCEASVPQHILVDDGRLKQLLMNIIGNSIKFTDRGVISVIVGAADFDLHRATITWDIRDSGCGIPSDYLPRLFDCFTQADSSSSRHHGGSGLGLSITKGLVSLMGGTLAVDSSPEHGSHFRVSIPIELITAAASHSHGYI